MSCFVYRCLLQTSQSERRYAIPSVVSFFSTDSANWTITVIQNNQSHITTKALINKAIRTWSWKQKQWVVLRVTAVSWWIYWLLTTTFPQRATFTCLRKNKKLVEAEKFVLATLFIILYKLSMPQERNGTTSQKNTMWVTWSYTLLNLKLSNFTSFR